MSEAAAKLPPDRGKGTSYDAKNIQVLEGLEAVRRRPGMYIGSTDTRGLHHLLYEIVDNSIDEAMGGFADTIIVTLHEDNACSVFDNGRGIPVDIMPKQKKPALEVVMTVLHAGGKFGGGGYKVSGGLHGVGMSVVNALSERVEARVKRDGKVHFQEYRRGKPVAPLATEGKATESGTLIKFYPDPEVFETLEFKWEVVAHRLRELAFLNKGTTIKLVDERTDSVPYSFYFDGGLKSFVNHLNRGLGNINIPPVYVEKGIDGNMVEVALQYNNGFSENVLAFANNINTLEGGTHLSGFRSALTSSLNKYARTASLIKESDPNLGGDDVREGLTAVISVKIEEPQFEGQTKTKLGNSEVAGQVQSVFAEGLMEYLMEHPSEARRIIEKSVIAARAREAARKARDLVQRKSLLESATLPGKLADCSERDPRLCEIFVVEGDSAGGCFSGDTVVATVEGRDLTFEQLAADWAQGIQHFGYASDANGDVVVVPLEAPRLTSEKAELVAVELDTGEVLRCTPDHLFRLRDGGYSRADELATGTSLMPLSRKLTERGESPGPGYEMVWANGRGRWEHTHHLSDAYSLAPSAGEAARLYNHKVVSVHRLDERADVYDLTVDEHHNFALGSGIFVHNSAKQGRDRRTMAILPLRGKILNVHKAREDKVLSSEEIRNLITALGCGVGERYDVEKLRYHRIIIATDADVDGSHIRTLLLTFFWRYMRELVDRGHVYIAQPPLFKIEKGKQVAYAYSDEERDRELAEMNPEQLWETTMDPEHRILLQVTSDDGSSAERLFETLMGVDVDPRKQFIKTHAKTVRNLDI